MKNALIVSLSFLVITALVSGCKNDPAVKAKVDAARERNDGPAIWIASDHDSTLYLYGTVHRLPAGADWLRDDAVDVLTRSSTVFFEAPRDEAAMTTAAIITQRDGYQKYGRKLSSTLDGYNQKRLLAAALNAGLDYDAVERLQPWLLSDMLVRTELEAAGLKSEFGADSILYERARSSGKYIQYLETIEEQLEGATQLPERVQLQALYSTFAHSGELADQAKELNHYWKHGHTGWIWSHVIEPVKLSAPDYYNEIFLKRNERWADRLSQFMESDGTAMAVTGIGHLVGEDSLPELLRARGYTVERHFAYRGQNVIQPIKLDVRGGR